MFTHVLKTWPEPYMQAALGCKKAEVRWNDRAVKFQVGHTLILAEWLPEERRFTGRQFKCVITHVQKGFGLPDGLVVLSIE